jgi:hypothetical protein
MNKILLFSFLLFYFQSSYSQGSFERTFGDTSINNALNIVQTRDNGFMITSRKGSNNLLYIIKTNYSGDTLWTKTYSLIASKGIQTLDGGFAFAGACAGGACLFKTDSLGDSLWLQIYHPSFYSPGFTSLIETYDHEFVLAGRVDTSTTTTICCSIILVRTDSLGNMNYCNIWPNGYANDIIQDKDSNILVAWGSIYNGPPTPHVTKYNKDLIGIWYKTFWFCCGMTGLNVNRDGSYVLSLDITPEERIIKTDTAGNEIWNKVLIDHSDGFIGGACETFDNGYVAAGATYGMTPDLLLMRIDSSGDTVSSTLYGGSGADYANSIIVCNDSGYAIVGNTTSFSAINTDIYFIKTDKNGLLTSVKNYPLNNEPEISIFPNPCKDKLNVRSSAIETCPVTFEITDLTRRVFQTVQTSPMNSELSTASLPAGIYILTVTGDSKLFHFKFFKD